MNLSVPVRLTGTGSYEGDSPRPSRIPAPWTREPALAACADIHETYERSGFGLNMPSCPAYEHDFDALRAASARVVIGVGEESGQQVAGRAGTAVAARLGTPPVTFPGGHDGFLGGEYGGMGSPDAFAATLRAVLTGAS
jgi:hypothetical protein